MKGSGAIGVMLVKEAWHKRRGVVPSLEKSVCIE